MPIQLGSVFGKIVLDASGAKEGVKQARTGLQGLRADVGVVAGAVAGLTVKFVEFGTQAARAILDVAEKGIELQTKLETAGVTFSQFFGDPKLGQAALQTITELSNAFKIDPQQGIEFGRQILPRTESMEQFKELLRLTAIQARATGVSIENITPAVREYISSGDISRVREWFDISTTRLRELEKEMGPAAALMTVLNEKFAREGTASLEAFDDTAAAKFADLQARFTELQLAFSAPVFESLKETATEALGVFKEHKDDIELVVKAIGDLAAKFVDLAGVKISGFLDDLDYKAVVGLVDNFHKMLLTADTLTEVWGGIDFNKAVGNTNALVEDLNKALRTAIQLRTLTKAEAARLEAIQQARGAAPHVEGPLGGLAEPVLAPARLMAGAGARMLGLTSKEEEAAGQAAFNKTLLEGVTALEGLKDKEEELKREQEERAKSQDEATESDKDAIDATLALKSAQDGMAKSQDEAAKTEKKIAEEEKALGEERTDMMIAQERERLKAELDFAREREDIARDNLDKIADVERKNDQEIADAALDLSRKEEDIARDQARAQTDAAREAAQARLDVETDYRRKVEDIYTDFETSAEEAILSQDAEAYLKAQRQRDQDLESAKTDRDRDLEDAATAEERKREELRVSQEREVEDAQITNQQKLEDLRKSLERELEEQRINYSRELTAQNRAEARKREDLRTSNEQEVTDFNTKESRKLETLRASLAEQLAEYESYAAKVAAIQVSPTYNDSGAHAGSSSAIYSASSIGGRASGGYAVQGLYALGEEGREFVLNAETTRLAEVAVGGQLDQGAILAALGTQSYETGGQAGTVNLAVGEGAIQITLNDVGSKDTETLMAEFEKKGKSLAYQAIEEVFNSVRKR